MKILYLTFDDLTVPLAWSVHVRSVINGLVARGHSVRLVCPGGAAPGVKVDCDPLPPGKFHHVAGSLSTFVKSGRSFGPDLVYVRGIHATVTPALAARRLERPLVVELNGLLEHEVEGWRRAVVRKSHRFTLRRTARVITISPLIKQAIATQYEYPEERIDVVPNGVDTQLFRPGDRDAARRSLDLPLDRRIVVCVAGFFAHHALDFLIAATAKAKAMLVLVGKDGLRGGDVYHAGRVPHERVPDYLAAADVCAYVLKSPHAQFGFSPLKLYEYMAAGRPVLVATDQKEIEQFVNGSGIGIAVPLSLGLFADALSQALASSGNLTRWARTGRELAEAEFSWSRAVGQVEESLRRAVTP
jgi:glycosyltransferase involved in cell wall biosynthesis